MKYFCHPLAIVSTICLLLLIPIKAKSQIIPDTTLPNNSIVIPHGNSIRIEGGTKAGGNLFHSFAEFSLPTSSEAYFNNAADIQNILSRVTGRKVSNIDGLIRANATANLFLINPNGIIFGPNAQLNIGGSFFASTASSIKLADGSFFSATQPNAPPLLTVNVPIGLQYGDAPGSIVNRWLAADSSGQIVGMQVNPNQTIGLIGGNVRFEGGRVNSPQGRIEIGSVGSNSLVNLTPTNNSFALDYSGVQNFQDIQLDRGAIADASGVAGGDIQIQARRLSIRDGSQILSLTSGSEAGGDVTLKASETVEITGIAADGKNPSRVSSVTQGAGNGGNLTIETRQLFVRDGAQVLTGTEAAGNGGNLAVRAAEFVEVSGANPLNFTFLQSDTLGAGKGGNLTVETGQLLLQGTAFLSASTLGAGTGGNLTVRASDAVTVVGTGFENLELLIGAALTGQLLVKDRIGGLLVSTAGIAPTGEMTIDADSLTLQNGALVFSPTFGEAKGGNINIRAANSIDVVGSIIFATTALASLGDAGNITINTKQAIIRDGAVVSATTLGNGRGGDIAVNASESFEVPRTIPGTLLPTGIINNTVYGTGVGGNISIETGRFINLQGGLVVANSGGIIRTGLITLGGPGGNIFIKANESVEISGASADGSITSGPGTTTFSSFPAGNLTISTPRLRLADGAIVSSATVNSGNGGTLTINASESLELSGTSAKTGFPTALVTSSGRADIPQLVATGSGGDLRISTKSLVVRDGATLDVRSFGLGNAGALDAIADTLLLTNNSSLNAATAGGVGGNILVRSRDIQLRQNSNITTNSGSTDGGNITLNTDTLVALENSDISANALVGRGGRVNINARAIFGSQYQLANTPGSDITATGGTPDLSGTVQINTPDINAAAGLVELPHNFTDLSDRIVAGCTASAGNQFVVTGRGGLPSDPTQTLRGRSVWRDLRFVGTGDAILGTGHSSITHPQSPIPNPQSPIIEATGWTVNAEGKVELLAASSNMNHANPWYQSPECGDVRSANDKSFYEGDRPHK